MPKYDYQCKCGHKDVIEKRMVEASRIEYCSSCGEVTKRVFNPTPNKWNCEALTLQITSK